MVIAAVVSVPLMERAPDQLPDAVQLLALVDVHVSVAVLPLATAVGLADIVTVTAPGAGVAGGVAPPSSLLPPPPPQAASSIASSVVVTQCNVPREFCESCFIACRCRCCCDMACGEVFESNANPPQQTPLRLVVWC